MTTPDESPDEHGTPPPRRGFVRRHKALTTLCTLALVLLIAVGGWLVYLQSQLEDISRFDADLDRPGRPESLAGESGGGGGAGRRGVTMLLAGVDVLQGSGDSEDLREMLESGDWKPGSYRSDSIMVLHIDGERESGVLVSIPRDSYVEIEGLGRTKVNAAMSIGGPELLARTVEDLTQVRMDHVVMVDFEGFRDITALIGGVEVHVPETVRDPKLDKTWTKGTHNLEGEEALLYVRQRYGLPGGDFDRVQRQQNFLRALLGKATSRGVLANPITATGFVRDLSELIVVDSSLDPGRMRELALANRGLRADDLRFLTVPHQGTATIGGASVVRVEASRVRNMFRAIGNGRLDAWLARNEATELPGSSEVR